MNDTAYDISHLLAFDANSLQAGPAPTRGKQPPAATPKPAAQPTVAEAQEALSRELMRTAEIHDALVQQYLVTRDNPFQDIPGPGSKP